ncbi:MAG: hypothetical protein Q9216_006437 [Gyalolechia sp. 2 TL-2023]
MVQDDEQTRVLLSLVVSKRQVKKFKNSLEANGLLDKSLKITPFIRGSDDPVVAPTLDVQQTKGIFDAHSLHDTKSAVHDHAVENDESSNLNLSCCSIEGGEQRYIILTNFELDSAVQPHDKNQIACSKDVVLKRIGLIDQAGVEAELSFRRRPSTLFNESNKSSLAKAVRRWLHSIPSSIHSKLPAKSDNLLNACKWTYTIYPPMLLLPPTFLSKDPWPELLANTLKPYLPALYNIICQQLKVTHIAMNGPIPALLPASKSDASESNILRSPFNLVPLHGDFGKPNLPATERNFRDAFWVSTVQNDITQVWAPLYTMFSRGNISEKTRLLKLVSAASSAQGSTAVDLYAGIGYFAFSYAKAEAGKVLCWELNGWSIEGLQRGAKKNGWSVKTVETSRTESILDDSNQDATKFGNERFLIFHESNAHAAERVQGLRHQLPPIRHVNCGYLPSSSNSWGVAVQALDPVEGGWIHAHENVPVKKIEKRKEEIVDIFKDLIQQYHTLNSPSTFNVECQQIEQVKAYAPGIIHCVFDIAILPALASDGVA